MLLKRAHRKVRKGIVISNKMDKSIIVSVERKYRHPVYKKVVKDKRKYYVHDPENKAGLGDVVEIMESRPISKKKRWRLTKVLKKKETGKLEQDQIKDSEIDKETGAIQ